MDMDSILRATGFDKVLERENEKLEMVTDPKKYFGRTPDYYRKEKDIVIDFLKKFKQDLTDDLKIGNSKATEITKSVGKCITKAMKAAASSKMRTLSSKKNKK